MRENKVEVNKFLKEWRFLIESMLYMSYHYAGSEKNIIYTLFDQIDQKCSVCHKTNLFHVY